MPNFNDMYELNVGLILFSALVTFFFLMGVLLLLDQKRAYIKHFIRLLIINIMMHLGEAGIWMMGETRGSKALLNLCCFLSFGGGAMLILEYSYCLVEFVGERKKLSDRIIHIVNIICVAYLVLAFLSMFNGMFFSVNEMGEYMEGPYIYLSWIADSCLLVLEIWVLFSCYQQLRKKELLCLMSFVLTALPTNFLYDIWYPTPTLLASTLSILLIFLLFYQEITRELVETEKQIVESRVAVAVSQIKPHFLYNTLSAIAELCQRDPSLAEQVTTKFAQYLRVNLEHMEDTNPIPFHRELWHVKTYLWIEKIRFGDDLNAIYDIRTEDFMLPSLSVQPLVENAVKHGMMGIDDVCTITIATCEKDDGYEIYIKDNGNGFDMSEKRKDNKHHVGLENVKRRVELMMHGTMTIVSDLGKGTCVSLYIPREKGEEG